MAGGRPDLAVIPAAGYGTRLRPLTDTIPKEMLTIGRMPVIGHVMDELREAGIRRAVVVLSPSKDLIRLYVGDGGRWGIEVAYTLQPEMRGVGDAILRATGQAFEGSVVAAFGDCALFRRPSADRLPALLRLIRAHDACSAHASVLCERVPRERTRFYGVLAPFDASDPNDGEPFAVAGIVEKPDPAEAPSEWVVAARWILRSEALAYIERQTPGPNGEVGVTEAIARLLADGGRVVAVPMAASERRCDVGNWKSLLAAQALASVWDPEYGEDVRRQLAACEGD